MQYSVQGKKACNFENVLRVSCALLMGYGGVMVELIVSQIMNNDKPWCILVENMLLGLGHIDNGSDKSDDELKIRLG